MLRQKATAMITFALGSTALWANSIQPPCLRTPLIVPCERAVWEVRGDALYLQAAHTGPFAYIGVLGTRLNQVDTGWDWGFSLEATYHYASGNDLDINWNHVDFSGNHPVTVTDFRHYETNWDAVNVALGQKLVDTLSTSIRLHAGVQYTRINSSIDRGWILTGFNSDYNGFGPRAGFDMDYKLGSGFELYGKTATALLVGTSSFSDLVTPDALSGSKVVMVPEFDTKLGARYRGELDQGHLSLEAGYMWFYYLNPHVNTATSTGLERDGSFAASGPYFGLNYVGAV
jgi:hypothetical protein